MTDNNFNNFLYDNFGSTKEAVAKVKQAKSDLHLREVIEYSFSLPNILEKFDFDNHCCSILLVGSAGKYGGLKVFDIKFKIFDKEHKDLFNEYYLTKGNIIDAFYTINSKLTTHLDIQFLGLLPTDPYNIASFEIEIPLSSKKEDYLPKIHQKLLNNEQLAKLAKIYLEYELSAKKDYSPNKKSKI